MAKLTRQQQQVFAGQAPSDMITAFGTTQTGSPVHSTDLSTLQTANYQQGWQDAIIADKAPFLEEMNGVMYGTTYQLAYLMQQGIPEWDAGTTYYTNSRAMGSDGNIYKSVTDDNIGNNPTTDSGTNWVSEWASSLAGKANINADNFSAIGKENILKLNFPDLEAERTLITATGQYTIPFDCYLLGYGVTDNNAIFVHYGSTNTDLNNVLLVCDPPDSGGGVSMTSGIYVEKGTPIFITRRNSPQLWAIPLKGQRSI